jgi:formylglycine-generating enzyme required for sulfatase activity
MKTLLFLLTFFMSCTPKAQETEKSTKIKNELDSFYPEMVFVEGGTFRMGADDKDTLFSEWEKPAHKVMLDNYWIGKYEVSNKQFLAFLNDIGIDSARKPINSLGLYDFSYIMEMNAHDELYNKAVIRGFYFGHYPGGYVHDRGKFELSDSVAYFPVRYVTYFGALKYCEWLSLKTGKKYRLPTEAEWEYAALGGKKSKGYLYPGSNNPEEISSETWYKYVDKYGEHECFFFYEVNKFKPNELGIYGMGGNGDEYCMDFCYRYDTLPKKNPLYTKNNPKYIFCLVSRGSWQAKTKERLTSERGRIRGMGVDAISFRVVMEM